MPFLHVFVYDIRFLKKKKRINWLTSFNRVTTQGRKHRVESDSVKEVVNRIHFLDNMINTIDAIQVETLQDFAWGSCFILFFMVASSTDSFLALQAATFHSIRGVLNGTLRLPSRCTI